MEMTRQERITGAVYQSVDDLNGQLPRSQRLVKSLDTPLLGAGSTLDSLGLVNLIAAAQQRIEETFGVRLTLADGAFLTDGATSSVTLGEFINFIDATLDKRTHA